MEVGDLAQGSGSKMVGKCRGEPATPVRFLDEKGGIMIPSHDGTVGKRSVAGQHRS
jgi:hypothetical protein